MAVGAAWSATLRGTEQVAVAFFGDGATNIGAFHEALNLAAVWKLPVVFVCENNLYMEYTPIGAVTAVANPAADRAAAYDLPAELIDGNDVLVVRDAVARAAQRGRAGDGPDHHRGADLPALRTQPHRPGASTGRRTRCAAGWPATRCWWPGPSSSEPGVDDDAVERGRRPRGRAWCRTRWRRRRPRRTPTRPRR